MLRFEADNCQEFHLRAPFIAALVLERPADLRPQALIAELRRQRPDRSGKIEIRGEAGAADGLLLKLGSDLLTVAAVDAPLPAGTLDAAIAGNLLWPDAGRVLFRHRAHVTVTSLQKPKDCAGRLTAAASVTGVCAAIAVLTAPIGVYWGPSETVCEANHLRAAAAKMAAGDWPIDFWVRLRLLKGKAEGGAMATGCATIGLASFIGREIEFEPAFLPPGIAAQWVRATALYLLTQGPAPEHGETLGMSATGRVGIEDAGEDKPERLPNSRYAWESMGAK